MRNPIFPFASALRMSAVAPLVLSPVAAAGRPAHAQPSIPHVSAAQADVLAVRMLRKMTTEEKIVLLHGNMPALISKTKRPEGIPMGGGYVAAVPRLGIPAQFATDASLGVANPAGMRKGDVATALPSGMAMAATWNPALVYEAGRMIGSEARAKGFNVMLAGGANLVRDPRGGRSFEYLGEDPLLAGRLVGAQISGIQSNGIISTMKHFALNDQETGRANASVELDEAAMRESDLLAFQIGIEQGRPGAVMCAYNKVGGIYACENSFLLTDVLRRDWGFQGFVMSDWGAVHSTEALLAGLDQQQGEVLDKKRWLSSELVAALAAGRIAPAAVDMAARRILRSIYAHGLDKGAPVPVPIDYDANGAIAGRAAEEGIVLLKNEGGMLPLTRSVQRIVLIGGHGDIGVPAGGGSSQVTPVGGYKQVERLPKSSVAAAFSTRSWGGTAPLDAVKAAFPAATVTFLDGSDPAAAAAAARAADVAIVLAEKFSTEAEDSTDLTLGCAQDALVEAVASANPRTVVVLETGNAVTMPWLAKVPAVLAAWYPGQRGAAAIARVLTGEVNPSGRLPVTFPALASQLPNPKLPGSDLPPPSPEDKIAYGINTNSKPFTIAYPEGSDVGYRWFERTGAAPAFAFGHGLSYTTFGYDAIEVKGGKTLTVRFRVTNTGTRAGADVPQVYAVMPGKARRLIGWAKPNLRPGESRMIAVTADPRLLASFDTKAGRWVVAPGAVKVIVARNAADAVLTAQVRLSGTTIKP